MDNIYTVKWGLNEKTGNLDLIISVEVENGVKL